MFKKFSFVGVSSAAIALAALCPSPARALNFTWTFTSTLNGTPNIVSGTLNDLIEGSNTTASNSLANVVVTSATGGLGSIGIIGQIMPIQNGEIFVSGGMPVGYGASTFVSFNIFDPSAALSSSAQFSGGSSGTSGSSGLFNMNIGASNFSIPTSAQEISDSDEPFTAAAVPAPLPLLGLGAATAFSRKLKQRIALRRKREEVGEAG